MSASNGKKKYRGYLTWTDDMDQVLLLLSITTMGITQQLGGSHMYTLQR